MTLTFLARMKVFPDKEAQFIALSKKLEAAVIAHEPETLQYQFYRLDEPHSFAVLESFSSDAAEEAHRNTPHFNALAPDLIACIDGTYVREYLRPLA